MKVTLHMRLQLSSHSNAENKCPTLKSVITKRTINYFKQIQKHCVAWLRPTSDTVWLTLTTGTNPVAYLRTPTEALFDGMCTVSSSMDALEAH